MLTRLCFFNRLKWPDIEFEELKKRTRILVIDDNPFEYERLFKEARYAIDTWDDIDIKDINSLENGEYDIILLDIQGVGRNFSSEQGLGVLKHIKTVNPCQIILAYSNADYKLAYQDFFKLANGTLDKAQDFFEYKQKVDHFIRKRFSYEYYLDMIMQTFGEVDNKATIKKIFNKSIANSNPKYFEKKIAPFQLPQESITFILSVVTFAINTYSSLKGLYK
ncbi:hypothetical protein LGV61_12675 [Desulfurispirillum indicum]|uniref:hypothetical protein n=1 Tax=Desulfurispirillum indicum TaxID=936456 RepID=UPI001CFAE467|nr:hypothetical protein [Desulfurispirillum indicum]UCZ56565.1 hypothetical protein LGV61_12675 [Desulfurispirillum indicum]